MATWFSRLLTIGMVGADVELVQRKLRAHVSGVYDPDTASRVRGVQFADKLPVNGMVDAATADAIGENIRAGIIPDWYGRELGLWSKGEDVQTLRKLLGITGYGRFDEDVEQAVRRFQSAHHLPLTGRLTQKDAIALGDDVPWRS